MINLTIIHSGFSLPASQGIPVRITASPPILKYPSGKSGYNKKIKQLLKAAGLHRQGSGAVTHYTMLELADRFKLMNLAFDQEDYRVDKNLVVI